jgi:16S rRNA (guanine527-N7)-methyltransferase
METENRNLLIEGAKSFGIYLKEREIEGFDLYLEELFKWNQRINLTAIRTERGVVLKHLLDSLSVYPYVPCTSNLLDLGSGAGFPGIPLKVVQPLLKVTLIDSVRKKVDFQRHIIRKLGIKEIEAIHGRVQEKAILRNLEGQFDIVISRAFSDLKTLLILSTPFLKKGGTVVAMKGRLNREETRLLAGKEETSYRLQKTIPLSLFSSSTQRTLLLLEKE